MWPNVNYEEQIGGSMPHESFCLTSELQRWPLRKFCPYSIIVFHTFHRGWQFLSHFSHFIMLSMGVVLHRLFSNWLDWHWLRIFGVHPQRLLFSTWAHLVWRSAAEKHSLHQCKWMIHAPSTCKICTAHCWRFYLGSPQALGWPCPLSPA